MNGNDIEEVDVERAPNAATPEVGIYAYEVDVRIVRARLGEEPDEESYELTRVFCYEARVVEVIEEEPLQ